MPKRKDVHPPPAPLPGESEEYNLLLAESSKFSMRRAVLPLAPLTP